MTIDQVTQLLQNSTTSGLLSKIKLLGSDEFTNGLKSGQVVRGEVNKDLGQGRYLINFDGFEKVAETNIPFSKNDIIYGRVIGVGEQVELQRIDSIQNKEHKVEQEQLGQGKVFFDKNEALIAKLFSQYQSKLNEQDNKTLLNLVSKATTPNNMALAGLVINKLGFSQSPALINAIYKLINKKQDGLDFALKLDKQINIFYTDRNQNTAQVADLSQLVNEITLLAKALPEKTYIEEMPLKKLRDNDLNQETNDPNDSDHSNDNSNKRDDDNFVNLSRWLLNLQVDGSVSHRVFSLPVMVNGQVIEIDIALFDQKESYASIDNIKYRQIIFSLDSDVLGSMEITVRISETHIRVHVMTDKHDSTEYMAAHMDSLKKTISNYGWILDEVSYGTVLNRSGNAVVDSIIEHYISQDSLSRLV